MLFSLLRDCVRVGITAVGGLCGALSIGRGIAQEKVKSCLRDMGFVSREEFEVLKEHLRRTQSSEKERSQERVEK
ncbi:MAG: hypothetical protein AB8U44_03370 [Aaplasma endosymbiont of Hyalomma asiaticum]